ncbi:MAG: hypothetical protein IJX98_07125 [Clostridia bacterium]|nr:hypothetical protein [Clostridia bacterium]
MKNLRGYQQNGQGQNGDDTAADLTKKIAAAYDGKSGADIWLGILREAEKAKRAGTLSNAEIDEFYNQFAPLLSEAQKKQLSSIIERLKRI